MATSKFIECGKIINTHGCHGDIKLESWCNTPQDLALLKNIYLKDSDEYIKYKITRSSVFKQFVIIKLDNVNDMDTALSLKNKIVYASRKDFDLAEGEYFIADLIGVDIIDSDNGKICGKLTDIINRGASDIYVVETPNGERMIPVVPEFILDVDIESGIKVKVIPGLLD